MIKNVLKYKYLIDKICKKCYYMVRNKETERRAGAVLRQKGKYMISDTELKIVKILYALSLASTIFLATNFINYTFHHFF